MLLEWDKNIAGNLLVRPVYRYEAANLYEMGVGLRCEFVQSQEQTQTPLEAVQIALTVEQAQEVIGLLQLSVDSILSRRSQGPMN